LFFFFNWWNCLPPLFRLPLHNMYINLHSRFQILANQINPWSPLVGLIVVRPIEFPSLEGDKGRQCWLTEQNRTEQNFHWCKIHIQRIVTKTTVTLNTKQRNC
jgi:hypothetical protein